MMNALGKKQFHFHACNLLNYYNLTHAYTQCKVPRWLSPKYLTLAVPVSLAQTIELFTALVAILYWTKSRPGQGFKHSLEWKTRRGNLSIGRGYQAYLLIRRTVSVECCILFGFTESQMEAIHRCKSISRMDAPRSRPGASIPIKPMMHNEYSP